jgi:uncharacterized protein
MSRDSELDIAALVTREAQLDAGYPLRELLRIAPMLQQDEGTVQVHLRFHRSRLGEHSYPVAEGRVTTTLTLACQRCLEAVKVPVDTRCRLAYVSTEDEAKTVPESHDAVTMDNGRVSLPELVEDELLLALPLVPAHADKGGCVRRTEQPEGRDSREEQSQRPFASLRDLMKS